MIAWPYAYSYYTEVRATSIICEVIGYLKSCFATSESITRNKSSSESLVWQFIKTIIKQGVDSSNGSNFWLNGYVDKQNCRIWSEANPQVYVETPLHPEKLTVWCALWAGGILLQKR
ncbi:hypothetical protein TNCV_2722341 [Trichonephila clavipes]|nr:hypothetical protein TNCV_2722341 [Trichonephila clavipes]